MNKKSVERAYNSIIDRLQFEDEYQSMQDGLISEKQFIGDNAHKIVKLMQLRAKRLFDNQEYDKAFEYAKQLLTK